MDMWQQTYYSTCYKVLLWIAKSIWNTATNFVNFIVVAFYFTNSTSILLEACLYFLDITLFIFELSYAVITIIVLHFSLCDNLQHQRLLQLSPVQCEPMLIQPESCGLLWIPWLLVELSAITQLGTDQRTIQMRTAATQMLVRGLPIQRQLMARVF